MRERARQAPDRGDPTVRRIEAQDLALRRFPVRATGDHEPPGDRRHRRVAQRHGQARDRPRRSPGAPCHDRVERPSAVVAADDVRRPVDARDRRVGGGSRQCPGPCDRPRGGIEPQHMVIRADLTAPEHVRIAAEQRALSVVLRHRQLGADGHVLPVDGEHPGGRSVVRVKPAQQRERSDPQARPRRRLAAARATSPPAGAPGIPPARTWREPCHRPRDHARRRRGWSRRRASRSRPRLSRAA